MERSESCEAAVPAGGQGSALHKSPLMESVLLGGRLKCGVLKYLVILSIQDTVLSFAKHDKKQHFGIQEGTFVWIFPKDGKM